MASAGQSIAQHAQGIRHAIRQHCSGARHEINARLKNVDVDPKAVLYATILFVTCIWMAITATRRLRARKQSSPSRPSTPNLEKSSSSKAVERPHGEWHPHPFTRPTAPPYPDFSIHTTKPLPYRPFRHGPKYNITMGLRKLSWPDWIELDNQFLHYHGLKTARIAERGAKCCKTDPDAYDAAMEFLEELCAYLSERYPSVFIPLDAGKKGIKNIATGEVFDLNNLNGRDPMEVAGLLTQDDLALLLERPDGQYYLLAGSILLPGFWRLSDKFGMPLSEIHTSGDVPGYREKLETGMMRFFRRLKPEELVGRHNYFIQVDGELAWSPSIGDEDESGVGWFTAEKSRVVESHWFRSERQSLRRLPRTGAIVFTIRTYFHPITQICKEPYVPGRLASAVRSWGDDVGKYKGKEKYGDVLLEYLDRMHEEQVQGGLDLSREDEECVFPF